MSLMQVAKQAHSLVQRRSPANRMREHRNNRAHEEVVVGGGAAPHGRLQVIQEGHVGRARESGKTWAGGEEKEWMDCGADNLRLFGITGDWSTAALDPGVWYSIVREGDCRFMAAWVKEEENAS